MEKNHDTLLTDAQHELRKEGAMFQKQIMMETQQQETTSVWNFNSCYSDDSLKEEFESKQYDTIIPLAKRHVSL